MCVAAEWFGARSLFKDGSIRLTRSLGLALHHLFIYDLLILIERF